MRGDGDGWLTCALGHKHWGLHGAAGLLVRDPDGRLLLQHRAKRSHHGGTWGVPGGARDSTESAIDAALREAGEETDLPVAQVRPCGEVVDDHGGWSYTTVLAAAAQQFPVRPTNWESTELRWLLPEEAYALPMHPGLADWPDLAGVPRRLVLVVDSANVVGSRPDGWWKDRLGAGRRLRESLEPLLHSGISDTDLRTAGVLADLDCSVRLRWWPVEHLVVEGAVRPLADEPGPVGVRAADGSGDDEVLRCVDHLVREGAADLVVCVTADRELSARVRTVGGRVAGPGWLLGLLEP